MVIYASVHIHSAQTKDRQKKIHWRRWLHLLVSPQHCKLLICPERHLHNTNRRGRVARARGCARSGFFCRFVSSRYQCFHCNNMRKSIKALMNWPKIQQIDQIRSEVMLLFAVLDCVKDNSWIDWLSPYTSFNVSNKSH